MRAQTTRLVLALAIAAFAAGAAFADDRQASADQELQPAFEQINQTYFGGELKNVEVRWANLKKEDARGVTRFCDKGSFLIELDRKTNPSSRLTLEALDHEVCHVATHFPGASEAFDEHGPAFRDCMRRFSNKKSAGGSVLSVVFRRSTHGQ
jgi:predicted SprT family Zn-dependent metalloprotease